MDVLSREIASEIKLITEKLISLTMNNEIKWRKVEIKQETIIKESCAGKAFKIFEAYYTNKIFKITFSDKLDKLLDSGKEITDLPDEKITEWFKPASLSICDMKGTLELCFGLTIPPDYKLFAAYGRILLLARLIRAQMNSEDEIFKQFQYVFYLRKEMVG